MARARAIRSVLPFSSSALRSVSSKIAKSWGPNASSSQPLACAPRMTLNDTNWKTVRWLAGTSGRVRPLTSRGTSREAVSWLAAKVRMPSCVSRRSTPYSCSTRRAVAKSWWGGNGSVSLRVTRSGWPCKLGEMTKDMPSSSPNTSLMKGTSGTSRKLTRMGSPVRFSPRRSAMPSATDRWMTTPGARVVRGPSRGASDGGDRNASSAPATSAGRALGSRIGSGSGSTCRTAHAPSSHGISSAAAGRRAFVTNATKRRPIIRLPARRGALARAGLDRARTGRSRFR